jgi:tetratricopeptide (TPR) repeat protein
VRAFGGALLMALLLVLYLVVVVTRAVAFLQSGQPVGIAIGVALLVLPVIGAYLLVRELLFGLQATRLTQRLRAEGALPGDDLPRRASGRVERAAADAAFGRYAEAAEARPDDWRAWLRLGLAYDLAGDRRRARAAVRRAIALSR